MASLPVIFGAHVMDALLAPLTIVPCPRFGYCRPWSSMAGNRDNGSTVAVDKDKFQVNLDVQKFKPEEITAKVTGNKQITIEGKHDEKADDHGFISRHFIRRYAVPDNYDMENIVSNLSSDGVLTFIAPNIKTSPIEHKDIPINQTGKPAINQSKEQNAK